MDPTMISVFAVGATLLAVGGSSAALILTDQRSLRTEIAAVETRLRGEITAVETRLGKRIDDTKSEISAVGTRLEDRIARLADRLDGLAALRGVPPPAPPPDESPA